MDARVLLAIGLVLVGGAVAAAGAMPQAHLSPTQAKELAIGTHDVTIKGTVAHYDATHGTIVISDGTNELLATWDRGLPEGFAAGRTITAEGTLVVDEGSAELRTHRLQVGCPSTYEAAPADAPKRHD